MLIAAGLLIASKKLQLRVQKYTWDTPATQTLGPHIQGDGSNEMEDDVNSSEKAKTEITLARGGEKFPWPQGHSESWSSFQEEG